LSASHTAITLHAAHIGDHAHHIEVHEFNHHASAVQAVQVTIHNSANCCKVLTIAILYGTLSIKTDNNADHIVSISKSHHSFHQVISTNLSESNIIIQLYSNAHITINNHAKKNIVE
jgi:hypothetical protein